MQTDLISKLAASGRYENIITAFDVFSGYAFLYPVFKPTAVNTPKLIIYFTTRHAYLPTILVTEKGSVFVLSVIHETFDVPGITLRHATTKHAQSNGVLERTRATIEMALKMASREFRKQWRK